MLKFSYIAFIADIADTLAQLDNLRLHFSDLFSQINVRVPVKK